MTSVPKPTREPKPGRKWPRRRSTLGQRRREAKAVGDLTNDEWIAILAAYRFRCAYCGSAVAKTQDHIRPLAKGGLHTASNIAPACERCNVKKGTSLRWESRLVPGIHPYRRGEV